MTPDFHPMYGRLLTPEENANLPWSRHVVVSQPGAPDSGCVHIAQLICSPDTHKRIQATLSSWFDHQRSNEDWRGMREAIQPFLENHPELMGRPIIDGVSAMVTELTAAYAEIADLKAKV